MTQAEDDHDPQESAEAVGQADRGGLGRGRGHPEARPARPSPEGRVRSARVRPVPHQSRSRSVGHVHRRRRRSRRRRRIIATACVERPLVVDEQRAERLARVDGVAELLVQDRRRRPGRSSESTRARPAPRSIVAWPIGRAASQRTTPERSAAIGDPALRLGQPDEVVDRPRVAPLGLDDAAESLQGRAVGDRPPAERRGPPRSSRPARPSTTISAASSIESSIRSAGPSPRRQIDATRPPRPRCPRRSRAAGPSA